MKKMNLMTFGKISIFLIMFMFSINVSADTVDTGKYSIKEITFSSEKNTNFINNLWYATKDLSTNEVSDNTSSNLFPYAEVNPQSENLGWNNLAYEVNLKSNTIYTLSSNFVQSGTTSTIAIISMDDSTTLKSVRSTATSGSMTLTFTSPDDGLVLIRFYSNYTGNGIATDTKYSNIMLNEGNVALPYEKYNATSYKKYVDYNVADYNDLIFKDFSVASKNNLSLRFKGSSTNYTYSLSASTLKRGKYQPLYTMDDDYNNEYGTIDEYYIDDTHAANPKLDRIIDRTDVEFNSSIQNRDLIYTYAYYIPNTYFIQLTPEDTPLENFDTWLGCNTLYNHYYDDNYMDKPRFINDNAQCMTSMKSLGNLANSGRDNIETLQDSMISISANNKIYAKMKLYKDGSLVSTLSTSMITRYVPIRFEHKTTGEWKNQGWGLKFEIFGVYDDKEFDSIQTEIYLNGHLVTYKANSDKVLSFIKWGDYKIISLTSGQSMKESLLSKTEQLKNFIIKIFKYVPVLGDIIAILIEIIFSIAEILIIIADMFASLPLWLYQGLGIILICIVAKILKEVASG